MRTPFVIELGFAAALSVAAAPALAQQAQASASVAADTSVTSSSGGGSRGLFDAFSLRLGLQSAGPVLFRDTPDKVLQNTTVFQYGGQLAFVTGNPLLDTHRFGLGAALASVAKSDARKMLFITPHLIYETGHPLVLQTQLGWTIPSGTTGFASNYGGFYSALALGYSFLDEKRWSDVSVTPSLVARSTLATHDMQYSSFFLGAQIELAYNVK